MANRSYEDFQMNGHCVLSSSYSNVESVFQTEGDDDYVPSSTSKTNQKKTPKKQKQQTTEDGSETTESKKNKPSGPVMCGCGLTYAAYPALYTHIKRKHDGIPPPNTLYGNEGKKNQPAEKGKKTKVGRPPVFRENEGEPCKKIQEENLRFTAHNDLYVALGQMGTAEANKERGGRGKKIHNLVYDEELRTNENHPITKYYKPYYQNSQIHQAIQVKKLLLPTVEQLLEDDKLDCEDELKSLLDKTDGSLTQFLAAIIAWNSEKLRMQFFKEYCLVMDVLNESCANFENFHQQEKINFVELLRIMNEKLASFDTARIKGDLYPTPVLLTIERNRMQLNNGNVAKLLKCYNNIAKTYKL